MLDIAKFREGEFKKDRIGYALRGENPTVIGRMKSGFACLMDVQYLPGWCVLLAYPEARELNCLPFDKRTEFLTDMHILGEAIADVTEPVRMNYSILGNSGHFLHAHVYPRYEWEDAQELCRPVWGSISKVWDDPQYQINESHVELARSIKQRLEELSAQYY
jgi:diadenosine tetraphosphate (Ap4A) HIT family hydrolase